MEGGICIIATYCRIRHLLCLPATARDGWRRHPQLFDRTGRDHHKMLAPPLPPTHNFERSLICGIRINAVSPLESACHGDQSVVVDVSYG